MTEMEDERSKSEKVIRDLLGEAQEYEGQLKRLLDAHQQRMQQMDDEFDAKVRDLDKDMAVKQEILKQEEADLQKKRKSLEERKAREEQAYQAEQERIREREREAREREKERQSTLGEPCCNEIGCGVSCNHIGCGEGGCSGTGCGDVSCGGTGCGEVSCGGTGCGGTGCGGTGCGEISCRPISHYLTEGIHPPDCRCMICRAYDFTDIPIL